MTGSGTARYVDSSVERVQVKVSNFNNDRYVLTCNGVKVNLSKTNVKEEYVAGIRYKAWNPYSALHPTIGVDTPLVFDIVDNWNKRSIGGCTYYVSHPGGRSYETYPINSFEAESRRINRFWGFGHSQGEIEPVEEINLDSKQSNKNVIEREALKKFKYKELPINFEFPNTLDLRKK